MPGIELKDMTERDLLIQQATDIKNLCRSFDDFKAANKDEHKDITKEVKSVSDGKVSNRLFFWVSGIIIFCIIGLTAYTGVIKNDVVKNTTLIENIKTNG